MPRRSGAAGAALVTLVLLLAFSSAAQAGPREAAERLYHPVVVPGGGNADPESLDELLTAIRREHPRGPRSIVLLLHGFDARRGAAHEFYGQIADRLREHLEPGSAAIVGVCWESDPGPARKWLGRAVAHRVMKAIGLGRRARDPYFTISWRAQGVGRRAVREIAFRLQKAFPRAAVHLVAHSLGAQVVLNALAPDLVENGQDQGRAAFQPGRELKVDSVFLAGADLDARTFVTGKQAPAARAALERSRLWWFTVPEPGRRDHALKVRKMHVGRAAIGQVGPKFAPEDAEQLLREGRLVLDMNGVPREHAFVNYLAEKRAADLVRAIERISVARAGGPQAVAGMRQTIGRRENGGNEGGDVLSRVGAVLAAPATPAALGPYLEDPSTTVRLYAAWKLLRKKQPDQRPFEDEFTLRGALRLIDAAKDTAGEHSAPSCD